MSDTRLPVRLRRLLRCVFSMLVMILVCSVGIVRAGGEANFDDTPLPVEKVVAVDQPNDDGSSIKVTWVLSPDDNPEEVPKKILLYEIQRRESGKSDSDWKKVGEATYGKTEFIDRGCQLGTKYEYRIMAVAPDGTKSPAVDAEGAVTPVRQWFRTNKGWFGILLLIVGGAVIYYINVARSGRDLKIRKIAGLQAVEEAVGRATELGRPCLFVPGIQDINDIQTVAGITVLANVAKKAAEYDAKIEVPNCRSLVMTTARETVHAAFLAAGRPDAYNEDSIYYLTDDQFGFVAGVTGSMVREKHAACFYMGAFYAESLILAETGNSIGAIQIAGTAMPSQLPFFVAACDYTLIGEEFFAASAYLSGEPHQLGSLKGQDMGKLVGAAAIVVGCLSATLYSMFPSVVAAHEVSDFLVNHVFGQGGFLP